MASINKHTTDNGNVSYRVRVRLKGYPLQTASFDRLTDARKWAASTETAIREGRHFKTAEAKKHTLADLIERYINDVLPTKTKKLSTDQSNQLKWWNNKIGSHLLADVTPALIVEFRDELSKIRKPATVARYMAALSHAFTVAVNEWGWLEDSPLRKVKNPIEPRGRVRFLNDEERYKLLKACQDSPSDLLYICVILAISTGMRQGELMGLRWGDINLKDSYLILHETKNGERRRVPLAGHALELLQQHSKVRRLDTDVLFAGSNPSSPIELRKPWKNALKQAEIDDFRWHDLRHCTASYLAMNGASLAEIAEILGHKTLQMVKRYAHLSEAHTSKVVESMNDKIFGNK